MNKSRKSGNGTICTLLLISILFSINGLLYGHEDKPHADVNDNNETTIQIPDDSVLIVLDSIYKIIQENYRDMQPQFQRACYDCHSDKTNYPWYYKLPFVKGLIDDDITEARKHLDMSEGFPFAGHGEPVQDLKAIRKVLENNEMPPLRYRLLHWNAKFSDEEIQSIDEWISQSLELLVTQSQTLPPKNKADSTKEEKGHDD